MIQKTEEIPNPMPSQLAWQEAELGVLFHYDLSVFDGETYNQKKNYTHAKKSIDCFNPKNLDCEQWVKVAKSMGARFAIITASHETGFRLWQSKVNPYSLRGVKWADGKRDILAEFHAACLKYDIKPGVYIGTRWNAQLGVLSYKVTERSPITQEEFNSLIEKEVEEIVSQYGEWFEIWFDGGASGPEYGGPDILPICQKHQPNTIFYHNRQRADVRWGGSETGMVPYPCWVTMPMPALHPPQQGENNYMSLLKHGDENGKYWMPAMSDTPLRSHEWVWNPNDEHKIKSRKELYKIYCGSVGRNSTLIVGITPGTSGLVPDADALRCEEWGENINKIYENPLIQMNRDTIVKNMTSINDKSCIIEITLPSKSDINQIILQEDIINGERIREFHIKYQRKKKWKVLFNGSCIGHKQIIQFKKKSTDKLQLIVDNAIGKPQLKNIAIYYNKIKFS